ncbi:hypothetical protein [Paenibacillus sp. Soil522]|uniref:hypothetical protein n=1 Tax=Paenibacillus sp. Soil522 TaxID=1736388 RepID=UPI0006F2F1B1|nr:hypothetical protein [Paenibacillus sp. Soil522]KRE31621.1 hypothetical protein ASG81_24860 [Paenibacillus sp. Soil522]
MRMVIQRCYLFLLISLVACTSKDEMYIPAQKMPVGFHKEFYTKSIEILNIIDSKMRAELPYTEEERKHVLGYFIKPTESDEELLFKADFSILEGIFQKYFEEKSKNNKTEMKRLNDMYNDSIKKVLRDLNLA